MRIRHDEQMIVNGRLTQVGVRFRYLNGKQKQYAAVFKCACGEIQVVNVFAVAYGKTTSCGCNRQKPNPHARTHGHTRTTCGKTTTSRTYRIWTNMKTRCLNRSSHAFPDYGGRGIGIDIEWMKFEAFVRDMGECPSGMTIDRIDNNKGYSKENCRWASAKQQANNKRSNRMITIENETRTVSEWSEQPGAVNSNLIYYRLKRGYSPKDAVFKEVAK